MKLTKFGALAVLLGVAFGSNGLMAATLDICDNCAIAIPHAESCVEPTKQFKKAFSRTGYIHNGDEYIGTSTMKFAKMSKKGTVKVTITLTPFFGSKISASGNSKPDRCGTISGTLAFNGGKALKFASYYDSYSEDYCFSGECNDLNLEIQSRSIGGSIDKGDYEVSADPDPSPTIELYTPAGYEITYYGYPFEAEGTYNGSKFYFGKVPTLKFTKDNYDVYQITGLDDPAKPNINALMLSYKPRGGALSGSFKVYMTNEDTVASGKKPTIKKVKATIKGCVFRSSDGTNYYPSALAQYKYKGKAAQFRMWFDYPGKE